MSNLEERLDTLARRPHLLVAVDYDGTIAPLVDDPTAGALPGGDSITALRTLADLPQTHAAVISARSPSELAGLSGFPRQVHLVGGQGSEVGGESEVEVEVEVGFGEGVSSGAQASMADAAALLGPVADDFHGAVVEPKPAALSFHYRAVPPAVEHQILERLTEVRQRMPGMSVRWGDKVVEFSHTAGDKGTALDRLRHRLGAQAVLFLGDDTSDEAAFGVLRGPDVGVKVGAEGDTSVSHRVSDLGEVAQLLADLAELRSTWLLRERLVPIEHHSLLSDHRTAAMVTPDARITWLCAPRIDSGAVFAELLDSPDAGHFTVGPADGGSANGQRYLDDSMVLETSWDEMSTTDYLDCSRGRHQRVAGRTDLIRVLSGAARARVEFAPRLDFGRYPTRLECRDGGLEVVGAADLMALRADGVEWRIEAHGQHQTAVAEVDLSDGDVVLELRCGTASVRADVSPEIDRRHATDEHWSRWAADLDLDGLDPSLSPELVRRSALVLRSLCHTPTGAILAAPTTSLPETLGGSRNWDKRYCWLRDAAFTAASLVRCGSHGEAMAYLDWVLQIVEHRDDPERLQPLYLVTGHHLSPEADIADLAGYGGSRPVRIGNAAERQVQLDVFGPIVSLVHLLASRGEPLEAQHWRLVQSLVSAVQRRWTEPDNGIWEIRAAPRHHVYSKVMCWVTVDRAVEVADRLVGRPKPEWSELADQIREEVLSEGWSEARGAFTAAYGDTDLDASVLAIGTMGLIDPTDERFVGTLAAVERELRSGPTVYRYHHDGGLLGVEGGFHLMTAWLIDALRLSGRVEDARNLYTEFAGLAGPTGLLAEQYDPATGRSLGNHPQAYSHLGLIDAALGLSGL